MSNLDRDDWAELIKVADLIKQTALLAILDERKNAVSSSVADTLD